MGTSGAMAARARRRQWFRWLAVVGIPLVLLLSAEGLLELTGYGYSTFFFRSRRIGDRAVWTENPDFGRRFFPPGLVRSAAPFTMPAIKSPKALRVFVLGESAAMGDPDFKFGLPRMLEVLLRERFPSRRIEVINTAIVAINSHVILPIARDCTGQHADLWVIYMGNNEIIGPFGSASVFGARAPALALVRAGLWVKTTRLGQLLDATLQATRQGNRALPEWGGMEMMAEERVSHDSRATELVYQHFERNLTEILASGARAGVPMVLCTIATNIKDCAPFASLHRAGLAAQDLAKWQAAYNAGVAWQNKGEPVQAKAAYEQAARIDSEFAELAFRRGQCCDLLGQETEAASFFGQARDADALQFRADGRINEIIRRAGAAFAARGVSLVDAEKLFRTNSPHGLTGSEYFYEHVHLTPEGNYLLARAVAEQAQEAFSLGPGDRWLAMEDCLRSLGFTDWNRYDALNVIKDRIQGAPFTNQVDHASQLQRINEQLARYKLATKPAQVKREARQVSQMAARYPEDPGLRWNLAALLESAGDTAGAEEQWRALLALQPQSALPGFNLAKLLDGLDRQTEALSFYGECLSIDPEYYPARYALGSLCLRMDRLQEAIRHLDLAVRQKPRSIEARLALGQALAGARRLAAAEKQFYEILRWEPGNETAQRQLKALREGR